MKNHQSACFLLLFVVGAMLYGVNSLRNSTSAQRDAMQKALVETEAATQQAQLAQIQLKTLEAKTAQLRDIYNQWKPHFETLHSAPEVEQRIVELIREGKVFLVSQKFQPIDVEKGSLIPQALSADLVVEDDYTRALNWLGRLEESLPNCRITKCVLSRGDRGNDIHLVLQVQVPILGS